MALWASELGESMLETPPEKPSNLTLYWVALITLAGGIVGVIGGAWLFDEDRFQSDVFMFGSFFVGACLGGMVGWKVVMPKRPQ
jgi:hypothetical protein